MRRRFRLLALSASLLTIAAAATPARGSAEGRSRPPRARTTPGDSPVSPPGGPCWVEEPYPFDSEGRGEVDTSPGSKCAPGSNGEELDSCYLTVTSMDFRAWNRGLAATVGTASTNGGERKATPYGVWIFNGTRWFPDPTFPGQSVCKGTKIVWAGKLDYWLVGGPPNWANLCRFD